MSRSTGGSASRLLDRRDAGPKHDLWVVPYADMLTLLFALFVLLYSMGEVKAQKLAELRRSLAFAFLAESPGGQLDPGGLYEEADGSGDMLDGVELINSQSGEMKEFLLETLPEQFEEASGRSLEVVLTDNTIAFTASLEAFYEPGEIQPRRAVQGWLLDLFDGVWNVASEARIRIEAPDVVVGRDATGRNVRSDTMSLERLKRLRQILRLIPEVEATQVVSEFQATAPTLRNWEETGRITIAFSDP